MSRNCIFCRIVAGTAPATIVYQDDQVVAFNDIHPQAPVHVLIVPRRHIPSLAHVGPEDESLLGHMAYVAREIAARHDLLERGFRVAINTGPEGGQVIYHLHLHVMGGRRLGRPSGR